MYQFPQFLVREEAHYRALTRNIECSNALQKWSDANPGHSIRVVWMTELDFGNTYISVQVQGDDATQVAQVQAIIERLFVKTLVQPSEIL